MSENNTLVKAEPITAAMVTPTSLDALASPVHESSGHQGAAHVSVPYVAFRGKKSSTNTEALDGAGIKVSKDGDGRFYLMDTGEPIAVDPLGLHLIQYARFFTTVDDDMNVTQASFHSDDDLFAQKYREHLFALVAVARGNGQFTAATLQLRSAQCSALRQTIQLLGEPGRPGPACNPVEWAKRGAAHKISADARIPGGRFRTEIWSTLEAPKSGKGQPFNQGHGRTYPTPKDEVDALNQWLTDAWPRIQIAAAKYNTVVEEVRRLAETGAPAEAVFDPTPF